MQTIRSISLIMCIVLLTVVVRAETTDHSDIRKTAQKAAREGNWNDAFQLYQRLCLKVENDPKQIGSDLIQAWQCLQNLGRIHELDDFREKTIQRHKENWRLLQAAAESYSQNTHWGYLVAGKFHRGSHRGGGKYVNAIQRDRVRALQLMNRAFELTSNELSKKDIANFYLAFAGQVSQYRIHNQAWRLQYLTDLTTLPDYETGHGYDYGRRSLGAPVDEEGQPIFHKIPSSFESAKSDGERWRWLLENTVKLNAELDSHVKHLFASYLHQQFGVQTLASRTPYVTRHISRLNPDSIQEELSPYEVHTLTDKETIAKLAIGVRRFSFPDEFNYIRIFKEIISSPDKGYRGEAVRSLAQIYENRRRYDHALDYWKLYQSYRPPEARRHIDQINKNWGVFESVGTQPSGRIPTVEYRFRNGTQVTLEAYQIRVKQLLQDVKAYIRSNPRRLNWQKVNVNNIGWRLVHDGQSKYVGKRVAEWKLPLDPDKRHWDRRVTVSLPDPLSRAGAYLLLAKMRDGNTARIIIWVNNTVIIKKPLDKKILYYVADAVNGRPLAAASLDFFGYQSKRIKGKNRYRIRHSSFTRKTDRDGLIILNPIEMGKNLNWLATVTTGDRLAFLGFSGIWFPNYHDRDYHQTKTFVMTDRPVYRPNQQVRFKIWVRQARYDQKDTSNYAGRFFTVEIRNPQNEQIYRHRLQADDYGGFDGEFVLPEDASLGVYRISHGNGTTYGGNTFRVEEYKKPEFDVTIDAPADPVILGEKITAVVKAKYYFGSAVTQATVSYKVIRSEHDDRWYPPFSWDWLYGPGYWWYGYDYTWYPDWSRWGCRRPIWTWWPRWPRQQPEVVADGEVKIGSDGTVQIEIDTDWAKHIYGDTDHRYTVTAEVRDQSRRIIVGQGHIMVARSPFKVYAWVDRGHYRVGDTIGADFKAQTMNQQPVKGTGLLKLLRITYPDNSAQETEVSRWKLDTNAEGQASIQIQASQSGQYRLAYQVTDQHNHTVEGGYIFTIRGEDDDGSHYRFAKIELIPNKREYVPGETLRLQINTDHPGAAVILFIRPVDGIYLPPKVIHLKGKSTVEKISISPKDMPNIFVEAMTVYDGKLHSETREIIIPPVKRILNVKVTPSKNTYRPGQKVKLNIKLTEYNGEPYQGAAVVTVYDRALEYVSDGSNIPDIRNFFWKWRRQHHPQTESSLNRWFHNLLKKGEPPMRSIGIFGNLLQQDIAARSAQGHKKEMAEASADPEAPAATDESKAFPKSSALQDTEAGRFRSQSKPAKKEGPADHGGAIGQLAKPHVRTQFADTAYWASGILTDTSGFAEVEFSMPENLTAWKVSVWSMGHGTKVGEESVEVVTRKNVILRLQAPRFFVESDEVVVSANVHNYLKSRKSAQVLLELDGGCLSLMKEEKQVQSVSINPNSEKRVEWRLAVVKEGEAVIRMKALTDEESDAVQMRFPVIVHGMSKQVPKSGVIPAEETEASLHFDVPAQRRVNASRLELRYSPTLAGAMVDALPYLTGYPYGCTEQTLNRFIPTVITQHTLKRMGLDLKLIRDKLANLNAQEIGDDRQRVKQWKRYDHNPVFDEKTVADMVTRGIRRLADMQLSDGGWGWFSGYGEKSYPHTTALVVHGLQIARKNNVGVPGAMMESGVQWLQNYQAKELARLKRWDQEKKNGKSHADDVDAFVYKVLVDADHEQQNMRTYLYRDRNRLSVYAKAMFGMALHRIGDKDNLGMIMRNIEQYLVEDEENQTAYLNLPNSGYWWYWYGSEYEAHAYYLMLLSKTDPGGEKASRLVKYLLNNRKHATYWNSTRDTAIIVEALADYLVSSGEDRPNLTLDVYLDGKKMKTMRITGENLFTFDNKFVLEGKAITTGSHTVKLKKTGKGPVYFNAYLDYFTLEDHIPREGLEIKVRRNVYRLTKVKKKTKDVGSRGRVVDRQIEKYEREPLQDMSPVTSGDLVEVELVIDSKNDYEYLVFEDMKAAGFEPVEVRSGYSGNELGAYVEYRDRKVCFFVHRLARGRHSISYRLRAETPGKFSALPARGYAMYAPELKANSDEIKLIVHDD